uniref:hypothetical protein n=1 Tax=Trichocoleus desertorum TaxID=1481672 RepID=UPI0025B37DEE|nr:hypothetical protein [Trichocoleus desertorum]
MNPLLHLQNQSIIREWVEVAGELLQILYSLLVNCLPLTLQMPRSPCHNKSENKKSDRHD